MQKVFIGNFGSLPLFDHLGTSEVCPPFVLSCLCSLELFIVTKEINECYDIEIISLVTFGYILPYMPFLMQASLGSFGIFNKDISPITSRINKLNKEVPRARVAEYIIKCNANSTSESKLNQLPSSLTQARRKCDLDSILTA